MPVILEIFINLKCQLCSSSFIQPSTSVSENSSNNPF